MVGSGSCICGKPARSKARGECEACHKRRLRLDPKHRTANRQRVKAWQLANPEKRFAQRLRIYGISVDEFMRLEKAQDGRCAICRQRPHRKRLSVDHNHKTTIVRGLLCERCNLVLGWYNDDPAAFLAIAKYLEDSCV